MTIEDQIKDIEEEIQKTPYNKNTQHHIGKLKAKLARLKDEQEKRRAASSGGGKSYAVRKSGNATVALVGFPSVGKSTLLNKVTDASSEVGRYDFTTLDVVPGIMDYKGAKIQILDLPGIIKGASKGRGRGREVIAAARSADLIIVMADVFRYDIDLIVRELYLAGLRLNQRPVDIRIYKSFRGGLNVNHTVELTQIDEEMVKTIVSGYGIINADIVLREDINEDQLIDYLSGNKVYVDALVVLNKIDLLPEEEVNKVIDILSESGWNVFTMSAEKDMHIDQFKDSVFDICEFIRIFLKPQGQEADLVEPLVVKEDSTVGIVCDYLHRDFRERFRYARVWGPSAKFPGQRVSISHILKDEDILSIVVRR
ncbi:MAG: GTP-binding protein [Thermoplasmata archaeon]|nr:GTP-binding protein [Thermoplasmata archaeon]